MENPKSKRFPVFGNLTSRLNKYPPFFVYYLARQRAQARNKFCTTSPRRPELSEMAKRAGIPERTFLKISGALVWDNIKLIHIQKFLEGCGVDIFYTHNIRVFIVKTMNSNRRFTHLNAQQLRRFNLLSARWQALQEKKSETNGQASASPLHQNQAE